jgi:hypothetical protein
MYPWSDYDVTASELIITFIGDYSPMIHASNLKLFSPISIILFKFWPMLSNYYSAWLPF